MNRTRSLAVLGLLIPFVLGAPVSAQRAAGRFQFGSPMAVGPIDDRSYPSLIPGMILATLTNSDKLKEYQGRRLIDTLMSAMYSLELGESSTPLHTLGLGVASFRHGVDGSLVGMLGERNGIAAGIRLVSFSPGRQEAVDALVQLDREVRLLSPPPPGPRVLTPNRCIEAAKLYERYTENLRVAVLGGWASVDHTYESADAGPAISWLRPLSPTRNQEDSRAPAGLDFGVHAPFTAVRWSGGGSTNVWNPSVRIAYVDQVFRVNRQSAAISRWQHQIGVSLGVRNALNAHAPVTLFARWRDAPDPATVTNPRAIVDRTTFYTGFLRRDSARDWSVGFQIEAFR